ncbi:hypothetical protein [Martelella lutilitoris]|uniref:hypothetical protein n=1 Tax=Martelella lutilitoris TaxID=2583532 RepID=UPI00165164DE|nr:hypothetical protein [Martelella lutilitoris]
MVLDRVRGFLANHDMAEYEVAVHADILEQTVSFLDTTDAVATPPKTNGAGELGLCAEAAAI